MIPSGLSKIVLHSLFLCGPPDTLADNGSRARIPEPSRSTNKNDWSEVGRGKNMMI